MTQFTKKLLRFTFDLAGDHTFDNSGANRLIVSGLRTSANIVQGGGLDLGNCDIAITLRQLSRALAAHAVATSLAHTVREVGNSPHCPTRAELIDLLAGKSR